MKRVLIFIISAIICMAMFSCGKQSPYDEILNDYKGQMEEKTKELVKEAEKEVSPDGSNSYTVYMDLIFDVAEINSAGKSEMGDLFSEDPSEEGKGDYMEHLEMMDDAYDASCEEIAGACGLDY